MSVRAVINRHAGIIVTAVAVLLGLCGWVTWSQAHPDLGPKPATAGFFTVDDGKSWFVDDLTKIAPFDRDGGTAVRAYVFRCGDGPLTVGYLERHTEKWMALHEKYRNEPQPPPGVRPPWTDEFAALGAGALEVKRPGDDAWVSMANPAGCDITSYSCKGGADAVPVLPNPNRVTAKASNKE